MRPRFVAVAAAAVAVLASGVILAHQPSPSPTAAVTSPVASPSPEASPSAAPSAAPSPSAVPSPTRAPAATPKASAPPAPSAAPKPKPSPVPSPKPSPKPVPRLTDPHVVLVGSDSIAWTVEAGGSIAPYTITFTIYRNRVAYTQGSCVAEVDACTWVEGPIADAGCYTLNEVYVTDATGMTSVLVSAGAPLAQLSYKGGAC